MTHSVRDTSSGRDPSLCGEQSSEPSSMSNQSELLACAEWLEAGASLAMNHKSKTQGEFAAKALRRLAASAPAGDGERKALFEMLREFVCEFWVDKPSMKWQRTRCDDGLEMVHNSGDTIFFGDPNHSEPPDTARFDLIVKLANSTPALLRELSAASAGDAVAWPQHVAYFDEGKFHWMSGIAPRNCELYTNPPAPAVEVREGWRYEIQRGPDGETDYAWVYDDKNNMVCTAKTHHAMAIVAARGGISLDASDVHYLGAIKLRLERLYEENPNDCRLREHISDEVSWIDGLTAALSASPREMGQKSDGWQLVPKKSNRTMTMAACDVLPSIDGVFGHAGVLCARIYERMLEAAPSPPGPSEPSPSSRSETAAHVPSSTSRSRPIYGTDLSKPASALIEEIRHKITRLRGQLYDIRTEYPMWEDRLDSVEGLMTCGLVALHHFKTEIAECEGKGWASYLPAVETPPSPDCSGCKPAGVQKSACIEGAVTAEDANAKSGGAV